MIACGFHDPLQLSETWREMSVYGIGKQLRVRKPDGQSLLKGGSSNAAAAAMRPFRKCFQERPCEDPASRPVEEAAESLDGPCRKGSEWLAATG